MKTRLTARVLLIDDYKRLMLMRVDDPDVYEVGAFPQPKWVTIGGRLEEGEDVLAAAKREVAEETGLPLVSIGPIVWHGILQLAVRGVVTQLDETFIVARTVETNWHSAGWTDQERKVVKQLRWWTLNELHTTRDLIFPAVLLQLVEPILEGIYPQEPREISL